MKTSSFPVRSERGALLIVAMLMSAVIAISLTSYLSLTRSAATISNRALYNNAAMNLAENGLEEAMYSINQKIKDDTYNWAVDGWTIDGSAAYRIWSGYTFDQNATGIMRVYVYNYTGISTAPRAVARATITLGGGRARAIEKWVEVTLRKTSKFSNGLVAKNSITFNGGNVTVDSWDSNPNNLGIYEPFDATPITGNRNDNGSVGSISVSTGAISTNNGDVWGYVSTAGDDPTDNVGSTGSILGEDSPSGSTVDPARVATDFSASFDAVATPTKTYLPISGTKIDSSITLPLPADVAAGNKIDADGNYYYETSKIDMTNDTITINGPVVLKLNETGNWAIKMAGSDIITITSTGSLDVYTAGTVAIAGKGISNGNDLNGDGDLDDNEVYAASKFQLWGTKTTGTQDISINGNGTFAGTIYAPQGNVTVTGNGGVNGSVVANNITLTGNAAFHYDESLADDASGNPFRVSVWKEITSATDRAALESVLSFN